MTKLTKKIYKNKKGGIHFGVNAPTGFTAGTKKDVKTFLEKLGSKKLWRCNVCSDLHLGMKFPKDCPTCHTINAYVEISKDEFKKLIGI